MLLRKKKKKKKKSEVKLKGAKNDFLEFEAVEDGNEGDRQDDNDDDEDDEYDLNDEFINDETPRKVFSSDHLDREARQNLLVR